MPERFNMLNIGRVPGKCKRKIKKISHFPFFTGISAFYSIGRDDPPVTGATDYFSVYFSISS